MLKKATESFGISGRWLNNFPSVNTFIESYNMANVHKYNMAAIRVYEVWGSDDIIGPLVDNDVARGYRDIPQDFCDFIKERYNIDIETPAIFVKYQIDGALKEMVLAREFRKLYLAASGHPLKDEHAGWEEWQKTFLTEWMEVPKEQADEMLYKEYVGTEQTEQEMISGLPQFPDVDDNE